MYDNWVSEIESDVFTYLEYLLTSKGTSPFPELTCSTSSQNDNVEGVATFPTLYVHVLPPVEEGNDLDNEIIGAARVTVELQVFSNIDEKECRNIMDACIKIMKHLRFNIGLFPDPQKSNKTYFAVARFSRVLAKGELDYLIAQDIEF